MLYVIVETSMANLNCVAATKWFKRNSNVSGLGIVIPSTSTGITRMSRAMPLRFLTEQNHLDHRVET